MAFESKWARIIRNVSKFPDLLEGQVKSNWRLSYPGELTDNVFAVTSLDFAGLEIDMPVLSIRFHKVHKFGVILSLQVYIGDIEFPYLAVMS